MTKVPRQPSPRRRGFVSYPVVLAILCSAVAWADPPDPEAWFRGDYGPIWKDSSMLQAGAVGAFYHTEVTLHEPGGERISRNSSEWVGELLKLWAGEAWLGSVVTDIRTHRINESTASFTTRWLDRYAGGESEFSCGWYLADYIDGRWQFTHYAETDCALQDF